MKIMKSKFPKAVMCIALLVAVGLFSSSYAETPESQEPTEAVMTTASEPVSKVADYLINASGVSVDWKKLASRPYVLFYYSAHWCPPCRRFTPKLVEFYNTYKGGEAFEIVFVSSDSKEADMMKYMKDEKMPWLAVRYGDIGASRIQSYAGLYIPYLVMFDREGNLIEGKYDTIDGESFMRPESVLKELLSRL
jgi:nucleoredoxin